MIGIELRTEHKEGSSPAYAETYGRWVVNTPITEDEYRRFVEEIDKAKKIATNLYLQTNGLAGIAKIYEEEKEE